MHLSSLQYDKGIQLKINGLREKQLFQLIFLYLKNYSTLLDFFPVLLKSMNHKYVFSLTSTHMTTKTPQKIVQEQKTCIQPQKHVYIEITIYLPAAAYW